MGYFGAFAFASGASAVVSYEPATQNYLALERAASRIAPRWSTRHAAVGGERGEGTLFLDRTSWAHSLVRVKKPAPAPGQEDAEVEVEGVEESEDEDVLEDTSDLEDDADTIGADIVEVEPDDTEQ